MFMETTALTKFLPTYALPAVLLAGLATGELQPGSPTQVVSAATCVGILFWIVRRMLKHTEELAKQQRADSALLASKLDQFKNEFIAALTEALKK